MQPLFYILFVIDGIISRKARRYFHLEAFSEKRIIQRYIAHLYNKKASKHGYSIHSSQIKKIWIFWYQGKDDMPDIVKSCFNSVLKHKGNNEVIFLDKSNYLNYVDIPSCIIDKMNRGLFSLTHLSDIVRCSLLAKYGGWWMDATIYVSQTIEDRDSLYSIKIPLTNAYISQGKWSGYLWYMPLEHPAAVFLRDCLYDYWQKNDSLVAYYLLDHLAKIFYEKNSIFHDEIDNLQCESLDIFFFQNEKCFQKYEEEVWQQIKQRNKFFKCNWRTVPPINKDGESYYSKILGHYREYCRIVHSE